MPRKSHARRRSEVPPGSGRKIRKSLWSGAPRLQPRNGLLEQGGELRGDRSLARSCSAWAPTDGPGGARVEVRPTEHPSPQKLAACSELRLPWGCPLLVRGKNLWMHRHPHHSHVCRESVSKSQQSALHFSWEIFYLLRLYP